MKLRKTYRFRLEPNHAQEQGLYRLAGARRFVWNWALARRKEHYQTTGKGLTYRDQAAELTTLKRQPQTEWLCESDAQLLQQSLRDLDRAFRNFFEQRTRFPQFKNRKKGHLSFRIPQRVKVEGGKVYCPKVGGIRLRQSQPIEGDTKSATFKRDATGKWFVTLMAEFEMPDVPLSPLQNPIGIDMGLKDFATLSDGTRVPVPQFFRKAERRLKRAQRKLSRRKKGSKRREKTKRRVARIHRRVAHQRGDFLHKLTTSLVRRFDGICIENLCVNGMAKTKRLGKSVLDAAFGEFRRQLEYKAVWNRRHLVTVSRWFPSSRRCFNCGSIHDALTLNDREWMCQVCGCWHDRDLNAARNVLKEGLVILAVGHTERVANSVCANARGACVRLRNSGQRVTKRESLCFSSGECQ